MNEVRYIISDAAKKVSVEPHVLRYWEEELDLKIPRNELGHRYYRERDIEMLKMIKQLKDKGFQLRAIKMEVEALEASAEKPVEVVPFPKQGGKSSQEEESSQEYKSSQKDKSSVEEKSAYALASRCEDSHTEVIDSERENKMMQFRMIMSDIIGQAIRENNQDLSAAVTTGVSETVVKEMDYLVREKEEREEVRYQKLDELIREIQKNRAEAAATRMEAEREEKKKKGLFRRK